jgi:hypothetical protein
LNPDFFSVLEYEYNIINALAGVRPHMQAGVCMYFSKASAKVLTIFHSTKSFRKKVEILAIF